MRRTNACHVYTVECGNIKLNDDHIRAWNQSSLPKILINVPNKNGRTYGLVHFMLEKKLKFLVQVNLCFESESKNID